MTFTDDPAWIDSLSLSGAELRRADAMWLAANGAAAGGTGGIRPGDPGLLVTLTGMSISAAPGVAALPYTGQGVYRACNSTTWTGTVSTAHASLQRLDLVYLRVWDNTVDAGGLLKADIVYLAGTPGSGTLPSPAGTLIWIPLAQITVPAGSTTPSVTDLRPAAVAPGGIAPVPSARLATAGLYIGHVRYNLIRNMIETWNGSTWVAPGDWTDYPMQWKGATTDPALHSGTLAARSMLIGRSCTVKFEIATASDTTFGSGPHSFTIPYTSSGAGTAVSVGTGHGITPTNVRWDLNLLITAGQSVLTVWTPLSATDNRLFQLSNTQGLGGVTWATQQTVRGQIEYEIAA
ncbi:hypothetical protein [Actinacidiphila sp. ITFR-21]|uniref:hypothetical protein n=1 Tax=Actinacidiphila sp. ITFR-21 TaxID=3075199 RepID=UPI00288C06BA|nr:hypothetical protein [Streptomyces sp. ITFR-21]WNI16610.1 hypothetical protein RLT57_14555 [Streptomyces sp. ITFR-21]